MLYELKNIGVAMPNGLERKYLGASTSGEWFWLFPAKSFSIDSITNTVRRHHIHTATVQCAFINGQ